MAATIGSDGQLLSQHKIAQKQVLADHLAYWKQHLAGAPAGVELPTDYPRSPALPARGARQAFSLPARLREALQALSQQEATSLFTTLLAAFAALLYRYSGQEDLVVGASISPRAGLQAQQFLGVPGDTLAQRVNLADASSFRALLQRTREVMGASLAYAGLSLEALLQELRAERALDQSQLFRVLFSFDSTLTTLTPGQTRTPSTAHIQGLTVDLALALENRSDGLGGSLEYNANLFEAATIQRMIGHWQTLLEGIAADPDQTITTLPLLTEAERQQIVVDWNATHVPYPQGLCLHQLVEQQVERSPDVVAVSFEDASLTYRELNEQANQLAHYLRSIGIGPDALVGVCMERSLEMVIGLLGILKAGGAYVPLDPTYPEERLAFMLEDSQAPVLLTQARLAGTLPPSQAQIVCLDTDWQRIAREDTDNPVSGVASDHLAYVIFTSGSTGKPKGAMNTHRGICNRLLWMQDAYRLTETDRVVQKTPFSFDVSVWEFFWPLLTGARLVVARPEGHKDSAYLRALIAGQRITTIHFVPSMLQVFLEEQGLEECRSLRRVICSGEALPFELQERYFQRLSAPLHNLYGPTEAAVDVTFWACKPESGRRIVPIGRPIANTQIYLLDRCGNPVPIGVPGELFIGGVGVARGYLNRPELTAERFIRDPFSPEPDARLYKTGDLARYRPDGNIEYIGRLDFQIKIRGFRIELGEIEAVLAQHPAVQAVVVAAREDTSGDKRLVAYIAPAADQRLTSSMLRSFLKERLPDYMVPAAFVFLAALPLNANGKVDRRALPAPEESSLRRGEDYVAPSTLAEEGVAAIWAEVLKLQQVGVNDNFFELGGHSLLAMQALLRMQDRFQVELSIASFFEAPTVGELAAEIERLLIAKIEMMSDEEVQRLLG